MKRSKWGAALMACGMVLMLLACGLTGWNLWENHRAAREAEEMLQGQKKPSAIVLSAAFAAEPAQK